MLGLKDVYLDDVAEEQGFLFESVANNNKVDLIDFLTKYMESEYKERIDKRYAWYATKMSYEQLEYMEKTYKFKCTGRKYDSVLAQWVGEFLAYLQAYKNIPSKKLINILPAQRLYNMSKGLHDIDMELAVKKVGDEL